MVHPLVWIFKLSFNSCLTFFRLILLDFTEQSTLWLNEQRSFTVNREESYTTIVLCSRHLVPLPAVLEFLGSAPVCGDGPVGVWVDLASPWPVCQPQLQQCVTVSTQIPLCLSLPPPPPPRSIPTAGWDSMETQSVHFFSSFSMFTVVFHLQHVS